MLRRTVERISLVIGGALMGLIGYRELEDLQIKFPSPLPTLKPQASIMQDTVRDTGPLNILFSRKAYDVSYNSRLRHPNWAFEHITNKSLTRKEGVDRSKSRFLEDENISEKFRAKLLDYVRSGYDRGHMVPASDVRDSQEALDETFLLSNIAPQVGNGFNRDYWAHFEEFCRRLVTIEGFKDVYVFTGPAYLPKRDENDGKYYVRYEVIGNPPNTAVPTHFYKVILAVKDDSSKPGGQLYALGSFLMPNQRISNFALLPEFEVELNDLERTTGFTFLKQSIKDSSVRLCSEGVSECKLVANPKHVNEELRKGSALPEPSNNNNSKAN